MGLEELEVKRNNWLLPALFVGIFLLLGFGLYLYSASFKNRVLPGVSVGDLPIGGLTNIELNGLLRARVKALSDSGIKVKLLSVNGNSTLTIPTIISTSKSGPQILLSIDPDAATQELISYGKTGNFVTRSLAPIISSIRRPSVHLKGVKVSELFNSLLKERLALHEQLALDARIIINNRDPLQYEIKDGVDGSVYNYNLATEQIISAWANLLPAEITMNSAISTPSVTSRDIIKIIGELPQFIRDRDLSIVATDPLKNVTTTWSISSGKIAEWVVPARNTSNTVAWSVQTPAFFHYLETTVAPILLVEPRDAVFETDSSGKVTNFQSSLSGQSLDELATAAEFDQMLSMANASGTVDAVVKVVEPHVSTEQANAFGIKDLLGVGVSDFSGSAKNRIKNISNAVKKLHGVLIAPDEVFSTLTYTAPFTTSSGYLPELVIKGDQITPEIGGGLCQIGSTLFRMAMNSGLPIVERRNHSLVIHYYSDPRNGNPGTDATVYDPAPDFRFKNDTGHYVLLDADMNTTRGILTFRLWGTTDGRTGSYSTPEVIRWIPHEDTKIIETNTLPPGGKKCQAAFKGAETSFTYTRILPDGSKEDRIFKSYYRPLPEICLVGVAETVTSTPAIPDLPLVID
ncbi:MAG: VanW family protein [Candidatus Magasanikbacteria bacterium]|nr:VanW family protein [Candidatus Magasanikbacteria bacterium]